MLIFGIPKNERESVPFADRLRKNTHFLKHGAEFGARDADEYERMAEAFFARIPDQRDLRECQRRANSQAVVDRCRLDTLRDHFGISTTSNVLKTLYIVSRENIAKHGTSIAYLYHECSEPTK